MTAPAPTRPRSRVSRVGIMYRQAQCACGWRGPNRHTEPSARADQQRHKDEDVHRGVFASSWLQQQHWSAITDVTTDGGTLVFDPPNVVWPAGGQRIRIEDYDTDRPMLAVESFDGEIHRYPMRREVSP